jgi:hypothetical protein
VTRLAFLGALELSKGPAQTYGSAKGAEAQDEAKGKCVGARPRSGSAACSATR